MALSRLRKRVRIVPAEQLAFIAGKQPYDCWSNQLTAHEVLRGSSVFQGGFTWRVAQHVTATSFLNLRQLRAVLLPTQLIDGLVQIHVSQPWRETNCSDYHTRNGQMPES
jgi:hypothetical protein